VNANEQLIDGFYRSFQKLDADGMAACYAEDATFSDPVFPMLRGKDVTRMWHMLCTRAKSFELTFRDVRATDTEGSAHWEATYLFSATGRTVHNVIEAKFQLSDGKIVRHQDTFDLWQWCGMALGPAGKLLGWFPPFQGTLKKRAAAGLAAYEP